MKILLLDIETAPNIAMVWGIYEQNIAPSQLLESSYILCWAAKWLDDETLMWARSYGKRGARRMGMLREIHALLSQADAVVHFNGQKFDIPVLQKEFLLHNLPQPCPYKQIDLYQVVKRQFKFTSNKLNYVCKALKLGQKVETDQSLWLGCTEDNTKSWALMRKYNQHDVLIMERLYYRLLPWIKTHANQALYNGGGIMCPTCGHKKYQKRGYYYTQAGKYQRYQCKGCHSWYRGTKSVLGKGERVVTI